MVTLCCPIRPGKRVIRDSFAQLKNWSLIGASCMQPNFLFAYLKSLYHGSFSNKLAGLWCVFDTRSTCVFFPTTAFPFLLLLPCVFHKGFELLITASYKCWVSEKDVYHHPCENTIRLLSVYVCYKPSTAVRWSSWLDVWVSGLTLYSLWIHFFPRMCKPNS